ncbi:zinc finger protein ubi-d4 B-like [Liolophura sinensis]|uniref:zinc finger protein ubi-d4 B-like n=1 Tax=Liolophura sinensis TaxID=3198878 RepID=UPI0031598F49
MAETLIPLNITSLKRSMGNSEQFYKEATEQTANFNTRMSIERKMRLPFLDSQTGVAQNHTNLWQHARYRQPGQHFGQLYTYPAKRWKKKKSFFYSDLKVAKAGDIETGKLVNLHQISAVENPAARFEDTTDSMDMMGESSKDRWYDELENNSEPPDTAEFEDRQSDISDYEETLVKKKKRKGGPGRGRRKMADRERDERDDWEKPYSCEVCGARYKTRPGLAYHYRHFHKESGETEEERVPTPKPSSQPRGGKCFDHIKLSAAGGPIEVKAFNEPRDSNQAKNADGKVAPNNYCDFCLGDASDNKKTKQPEELVSCSDCGRSGHPTCLQFTPNMIISVKKYPWQCIECKSCGLCGTSDNDDQLLFCDDCDRGYHMYCLNPPLAEPPEGSWSCHLCIEEFHGGKKPEGMQ